jgi:hypothetical protein
MEIIPDRPYRYYTVSAHPNNKGFDNPHYKTKPGGMTAEQGHVKKAYTIWNTYYKNS